MSAAAKHDRLRNQIADGERHLGAIDVIRARTVEVHNRWLQDVATEEAEVRDRLERQRGDMPELEAAAIEERRLADLATKQAQLDELLEVERTEQARQREVDVLRDQIAGLNATVGAT